MMRFAQSGEICGEGFVVRRRSTGEIAQARYCSLADATHAQRRGLRSRTTVRASLSVTGSEVLDIAVGLGAVAAR